MFNKTKDIRIQYYERLVCDQGDVHQGPIIRLDKACGYTVIDTRWSRGRKEMQIMDRDYKVCDIMIRYRFRITDVLAFVQDDNFMYELRRRINAVGTTQLRETINTGDFNLSYEHAGVKMTCYLSGGYTPISND